MNPVQETESSKVDSEGLMMEIMHDGPTEEVESAVNGGGLDELDCEEGPPGEDVDLEELGREGYGDDVGYEMFDWVGVLSGKGYGRGEAVVELVDRRIEVGLVEETVGVIEEDLACECAEDDVADELGEWGTCWGEAEFWFVVVRDCD